MRLKCIKLAGFKSFVDPTTVSFPNNLSAVVGPNGCGKSNVIDAVRWVMGESSAKHLRGESMTDVIFNGSNARKPTTQASVELVFDNSDNTLTGEYANYNEVAIKRVVTRDAQSNYYLNSTKCRRKDITDIFLSHLHYDHIGGLAHKEHGYWELAFPKAKVWVSRNGWEKAMAKEIWYDEGKTDFLHFVDARADLHFMDDSDQPYPEIRVEKTGGHTEFHQVLLFDNGEEKYMQPGDVMATRSQVNRKFAAKYDFDPETSQQQRERLARLAFEENYIVLGYHDDETPIFRLTAYNEKSGYTTEPVESHVPA